VVGIVGDVRHQSLEAGSGNEMYLPFTQVNEGTPVFTMIVRSSLPLAALVPGVQRVLRDADPQMPTGDFQTVSSIVDHAVSPRRFVLSLLGGFAATALLLAALGIYALLAYSVSQRIPEIGIRMALGESAARVRWRILSRTMVLAIAGISMGAVLSVVLSRLIQSMLFGVQPADPITFAAMAAVLLVVAAAASFLPARRASATDPVVALRT
jgi:ABC-type antimicrobial peptide transport system permease subunit